MGVVPARSCIYKAISGDSGYADESDYIFIQPRWANSATHLIYLAEPGPTYPFVKVCNPTDSSIDDGFTSFNELVIED